MFTTNHPVVVGSAKICYAEFPTVVNALKESGLSYDNTPEEYAKLDNLLAKSQRGIGESSNLAQLALTYYWTKPDQEYYDNFVILSVLAQIIIDSSKRLYEVDAVSEIERIKKMPCMIKEKDFPEFMRYTRSDTDRETLNMRISQTYTCPMNHLQEWLTKIQNATTSDCTPTEEFLLKPEGKPNHTQMTRIVELVAEFDDYYRENYMNFSNPDFFENFETVFDEFTKNVAKVKIRNLVTINTIIRLALGLTPKTSGIKELSMAHCRRLLNTMYKNDRKRFLENWIENR